ncbi:nuclear transport factor 2 family protein [Flavobacterium cellulosilyticum]|uniref:Nuclear transport factor 2 family protein n=1 Tax=Flavobacterium cellulosilyticum TaxID=2541731 RepID=A0A4R5CHG7_9FLAO|nr:nuclear transport factor 2 family protein [Flavobacterium cellulosilyticum]TDD97960.1 nuclear transport factor 2 family protein [Flavobacterium cellulosilyticum]
MTANEKTIIKFYTALANADANQMCECYHPNIKFRDPIFGLLKGNNVCQMWKMLIVKNKGELKIDYFDIKADNYLGAASWIATYHFSKTNRKVVNSISTLFHFQDGLIIKQNDDFDIWKWSKQAIGFKGFLLGWTGFFQKKIQKQAQKSLLNFAREK